MKDAAAEVNAHLILNINEKENLNVANVNHNMRLQATGANSAICRLDLTNGHFE